MRNCFFCFALFLVSIPCLSQRCDTLHQFDLFYKLNSDALSWDAEHAIDSVFRKLTFPRSMCYVNITGYSDNVGTIQSNIRLAETRAKNVALYFEKYKFRADRIKNQGEFNSLSKIALDTIGDPKKRRVHVVIFLKSQHVDFFPNSLEKFEMFSIQAEYGGNVTTQSQTMLLIPSDAFIDRSGNEVNGTITILYREFRDTMAFLLRGVAMNDNKYGTFYNSTGMFELQAFAGKTQVFLKPKKPIGIIFGLNKRMPLLDLYYKNDSLNEWNFQMHLTDDSSKVSKNRYSGPGCGGFRGGDFCDYLDDCDRLVFLYETGLKYSMSELSISEEIKTFNDFQNEIIAPARNRRDSAMKDCQKMKSRIIAENDKQKKVDSLIYKIERVKLSNNKSVFHIRCDALVYNEILTLGEVNFQIRQDVPDSLFKVEWDYCKLSSVSKNKFNLLLQKNGNKEKLPELKMKFIKGEGKNSNSKEVFSAYKKAVKDRSRRSAEIGDTINIMQSKLDSLLKIYLGADSIYTAERDTLFLQNIYWFNCFWELSRQYMTDEEQKLSFENWILFFDKEKVMMKKRYQKIKQVNQLTYADCEKMAKERESALYTVYRILNSYSNVVPVTTLNKKDTTLPKRDTVIIPLSILKLGIYNTAQPIYYGQTKNGIAHVGCYLLKNDTINISSIYLIDKHFNSFLEFNGTSKYGPYNFPSYGLTTFRLIAFDERGNPYTCLPFDKSESSTSTNWNFSSVELSPIKNLGDLTPLFKFRN